MKRRILKAACTKTRVRPIERLRQREPQRAAWALLAPCVNLARPNLRTIAAISAARRNDTTAVDLRDL